MTAQSELIAAVEHCANLEADQARVLEKLDINIELARQQGNEKLLTALRRRRDDHQAFTDELISRAARKVAHLQGSIELEQIPIRIAYPIRDGAMLSIA